MKLLFALLAVSTALNAALIAAFVRQPHLAPAGIRHYFSPAPSTKEAGPKEEARTVARGPRRADPKIFALRPDETLTELVARLRAAGLPAAMIRAIAQAEIEHRFAPRYDELRRTLNDVPYWQGNPGFFTGNSQLYEQMNQLSRERAKALRELLGAAADAHAGIDPTEAQRQRFGDLPTGKIEVVQRIADDYADMMSQIRAGMQGITLPEDRDKFALLERERRADLAAVLTPEELADYEMRTSTVTSRLRTALTIMDASEAEFRAIYAAHQPHAEVLYPTTGGVMIIRTDQDDPRRQATQKIHETLKTTLGHDRFATYQRANDREFQQLYQLTRAESVGYDTLVRAFNTRDGAAAASMSIANDPALNAEQKLEGLKSLAQQSRTQILSTLGPASGPTYTEGLRWLTGLEQGRAFSILPDGVVTSRLVSPPRPSSPTKR